MSPVAQSIVLLFIVGINGFLALSEMALVSARKTRLQKLADDGHHGATVALELSESPTRFLASLQICITILGIAAGAWGGANLSGGIELWIQAHIPVLAPWSHGFSVSFVVAVETFLMVLLGELLPKRLALFFPERIAMYVAPFINHVGTVVAPAAHVLSRMTDHMIRLLPFPSRDISDSTVTEDEIKILVEQGAEAGLFNKTEETFLKRALGFADLTGADLMTPRTRVISINIDDPVEQSVDLMLKEGFSNYPVYRKSQDNLIGVVSIKKVYAQLRRGQKPNLHDVMIPPIYLPESAKASRMVEAMRTQRQHIIMLIDEFGGFAGVVSSNDLMEAVVGEVPGNHIGAGPKFVQRADGSWLIDGMVGLYELEQEIGFVATDSVSEDCQTLSGLVMHYLDSIPREGQFVEMPHWRFEVVDMDHNRIDKVLVTRLEAPAEDVVNEDSHAVTHS